MGVASIALLNFEVERLLRVLCNILHTVFFKFLICNLSMRYITHMTSLSPVPRRLLSDEVFERLRDAIVTFDLQPGEKVLDVELAKRFGTSRTPVREALGRLIDAGLVEAKPGSYTRVSPLNRREAQRTLAVIRALDGVAVEAAVPVMTRDDVEKMREANRLFAAAVELGDVAAALRADDIFHGVPLRAADNPALARVIEQLHPQIHRILYRKFSTLYGGHNTVEHHDAFVEMCLRGDVKAAARASGDSWVRLGGQIDQLFDSRELIDDVVS